MSSITRMIPFISLYLYPKDVFLSLSLVCKEWHKKLSGNYLFFWLRTNLSFKTPISLEDAKLKLHQLFKQEVLKFNQWISTSEMSAYKYTNSFQNMWNNNWINYGENSLDPFVKNSCYAAFFAGGYKYHSGHSNVYRIYQQWLGHIPEDDSIKFEDLETTLNLVKLKFDLISGQNSKILYPYDPCRTGLAFVNKIVIARPLYYVSTIRTVVIFFSQIEGEDINLERFNITDNLVSIEDAKILGVVNKEVNEEKIKYLEFKKRDEEWYPVMWIQFLECKLDHFEIDLKRIHQVGRIMVKWIDVDFSREASQKKRVDPSNDFLYCLFMGTEIKKEEIKEVEV